MDREILRSYWKQQFNTVMSRASLVHNSTKTIDNISDAGNNMIYFNNDDSKRFVLTGVNEPYSDFDGNLIREFTFWENGTGKEYLLTIGECGHRFPFERGLSMTMTELITSLTELEGSIKFN